MFFPGIFLKICVSRGGCFTMLPGRDIMQNYTVAKAGKEGCADETVDWIDAPAYNCVAGIDTKDPQVSTPPHFNWYSIPQKGVCVHLGNAILGASKGDFRLFSEKFQIS